MEKLDLQRYRLIAVMGATGSGKSTFINLASGSDMRVGAGLVSCTDEVVPTAPFEFEGQSVVLIDTPGFDDTNKSDTDVLKMIAAFLATSYENGLLLAGIVFMHRISDVRMGGTSVRNFKMFRKLCGTSSLKNVAIVTNMWGSVPQDTAEAREHELSTSHNFFKPVLSEGALFLRHTNTYESVSAILQRLVYKAPVAIQIQRELVDEKKTIEQTAAGSELRKDFVELEEKHRREIRELRVEMQEAVRERDEQTRRECQMEIDRLHEKVTRIQTENESMSSKYQEEKTKLDQRVQELGKEAQRLSESQRQQAMDHLVQLKDFEKNAAEDKVRMLERMNDLQSKMSTPGRHQIRLCVVM